MNDRLAKAIVDFWWAPFHDAKRDVRALPLTHPWVLLVLSYYWFDDPQSLDCVTRFPAGCVVVTKQELSKRGRPEFEALRRHAERGRGSLRGHSAL